MGVDALQGNGITRKLLYFLRDKALTPTDEPLRRVRKSRILLFVAVQLVGFGATMAITQTIGMSYFSSPAYPFVHLYSNSCHWFPDRDIPAGASTNVLGASPPIHRRGTRYSRRTDSVPLRQSYSPLYFCRVVDKHVRRRWSPSVE